MSDGHQPASSGTDGGRPDERFWSAFDTGALLVVAGAVSVALHGATGEWPAGFDGMMATLFAVTGLGLLGYSVTFADEQVPVLG